MTSRVTQSDASGSTELLEADKNCETTVLNPHDGENEDSSLLSGSMPTKKKNRGRRKGATNRGPTALPKFRGTGFEEYFADPPMTPDEAAEEKIEIYARAIPFEERIQSCIQRFRARRRLQGDQVSYFNEYLFLGGIDTSPAPFVGLDPSDLKALTPAQRRGATATDTIQTGSSTDDRFYNGDDTAWSVDFTGVAAGFFSITLEQLTCLKPKPMESAIALIENFLKYVMHHDVCPEYKEDLSCALDMCCQAREEWPMLKALRDGLPGYFNMAAVELFSSVGPSDWSFISFSRPNDFDPEAIFCAVCALQGEIVALDRYAVNEVRVVNEYCCTVEVIKVHPADEATKERFARLQIQDHSRGIEPVGKMLVKPAFIEDDWEQTPTSTDKDGEYWLFLENSLLSNIKSGMKFTLKIGTLNVGISYIKSMINAVPTFYTFLPQQMMKHYRQPGENERPAPSVHDGVDEWAPRTTSRGILVYKSQVPSIGRTEGIEGERKHT